LAFLVLWALRKRSPQTFFLAGALSILYAASDELHQTFVPGRQGTLWDVVIDGFGIAVVLLLWWRFRMSQK
ncbi:MAG: VanZ family protein, partial [bacterium]